MVRAGETLSLDFEVAVRRDGRRVSVRFGDLIRRTTIVSVYLRNNTSQCDLQVAGLVGIAAECARRGVDIVAISRDTCGSHARFAQKMGAAFTLVSDPESRFSQAAAAMIEKMMYGRKYLGPRRADYVIEPDGRVRAVVPDVDAAGHADQVLTVLDELGLG